MKGISKFAFVLVIGLLLLAGCQSQNIEEAAVIEAPAPAAVPADMPAAPEPAAEPEQAAEPAETAVPVAAEPAQPVAASFGYLGYELGINAYEDYAVITYPSIVTKDDVDFFMGEMAKALPDLASEIVYSFDDDTTLRLQYPAGLSEAELRAYASIFGSAVLEVARAIYPGSEPFMVTYSYDGYEVAVSVSDGVASMSYPSAISSADIESFFAFENVQAAGSGILDGVYYTVTADGQADFTYPETMSRTEFISFSAIAVSDMIAFFAV